jgi:hypothetical protein
MSGILIERGERTGAADKRVIAVTRKADISTISFPTGIAAPPPIAGRFSFAPVPCRKGEIATNRSSPTNARSLSATQSGKNASRRKWGTL